MLSHFLQQQVRGNRWLHLVNIHKRGPGASKYEVLRYDTSEHDIRTVKMKAQEKVG